jgi:hypothetical protein
MLAGELSNAQLLYASSIIELRTRPDRLTQKISEFVDDCWVEVQAPPARRRSRRAATA